MADLTVSNVPGPPSRTTHTVGMDTASGKKEKSVVSLSWQGIVFFNTALQQIFKKSRFYHQVSFKYCNLTFQFYVLG